MKRVHILLGILVLALLAIAFRPWLSQIALRLLRGEGTVQDRLREYGPAARARMANDFRRAKVPYPPERVVLVGLKQESVLQVYAAGDRGLRLIRSYPIQAASGVLGPKLRYGDGQVPEGIYRVTFLNPNSRYHLSLRLGYPNDFDTRMGRRDGREDLGSDIMIHGGCASIGCLAMGDEAAEDLFVLAADTGIGNMRVILSPVDFRVRSLPDDRPPAPEWADDLYSTIKRELKRMPVQ